jgi:nucleotidyltransferase substrate binding protein (TIGR01987 family)
MENKDIRWHQRFANFSKALLQLTEFIEKGNAMNKMEEQGMIKAFEYNYELAWNLIKDFYESQGETEIRGSRDAFRMAFKRGSIIEGEQWMDMIESRKKSVHSYDEATAAEIILAIKHDYFDLFKELHKTMEKIMKEED